MNDKTQEEHLQGVDGWLAFPVFALMVIGPILAVGLGFTQIWAAEHQYSGLAADSNWQNCRIAFVLVAVIGTCVSMASGHRLWRIHGPVSVDFAAQAEK